VRWTWGLTEDAALARHARRLQAAPTTLAGPVPVQINDGDVFNFVITDAGKFVEIQGTAEAEPFSAEDYGKMAALALAGAQQLFAVQRAAVARARV
jgi:hypothetical protein